MGREAARVLHTLSCRYQRGVAANAYEVIAIDHGSSKPLDPAMVRSHGPNFRLVTHTLGTVPTSPAAAINAAAPDMAGKITFEPIQLATPTEIDESMLVRALGPSNWRPLADGVRQTMEHFRQASAAGKVAVDQILAT